MDPGLVLYSHTDRLILSGRLCGPIMYLKEIKERKRVTNKV